MKNYPGFFKPFFFLFITTSIAAFLLYFGVGLLLLGRVSDFSPVFVTDGHDAGQFQEITEHPFAFLLTISGIFSLIGTFWLTSIAPKFKRLHFLQILIIPWIALIITSPIWGLILSLYSWPQSSWDDSQMMLFHYLNLRFGLRMGWLSGIISFPINVLSFATVCILIFVGRKLFLEKPKPLE